MGILDVFMHVPPYKFNISVLIGVVLHLYF
jgi:hypothetical protein